MLGKPTKQEREREREREKERERERESISPNSLRFVKFGKEIFIHFRFRADKVKIVKYYVQQERQKTMTVNWGFFCTFGTVAFHFVRPGSCSSAAEKSNEKKLWTKYLIAI